MSQNKVGVPRGVIEYMGQTDPGRRCCMTCHEPLPVGGLWVRLWPTDRAYSTAHHLTCYADLVQPDGGGGVVV